MAELLLRRAQTVGELRGRAARMEPIKDLGELRPTLDSLEKKGLISYLTPAGRGSVVTHALYLERELDKLRREAGAMHSAAVAPAGAEHSGPTERNETPAAESRRSSNIGAIEEQCADSTDWSQQIASLREDMTALRSELAAVRTKFESTADQLRHDLTELNRQLGN